MAGWKANYPQTMLHDYILIYFVVLVFLWYAMNFSIIGFIISLIASFVIVVLLFLSYEKMKERNRTPNEGDYWYLHCEKGIYEEIYVIDGVGRNKFDSMNYLEDKGMSYERAREYLLHLGSLKYERKIK
ncbi:hypothetical protein LG291_25130 (plasmid) [Cytobacillus firmus]|uniref:Uncharacterized protein n=1 Tax=Cytobacillus firmus DS1 TaxID=1307436 RepID=W7L098_CYTFI|nr:MULTISPECIES: hypothetical protein [Bacillaceae]EWG08966.1 hypothetical protein PBF_21573 [Cytobacillus firmus DS1]MBN8203879.1 hypothetical protein [Bacillus sp. NTK034]